MMDEELPVRIQAEIEREREQILSHAYATYDLVFHFDLELALRAQPMPAPRPAALKLQLQEYAVSLFDAEAKHYAKHPSATWDLRMRLIFLSVRIESEITKSLSKYREQLDFNCSGPDRLDAMTSGTNERIQYWIGVAAAEKDRDEAILAQAKRRLSLNQPASFWVSMAHRFRNVDPYELLSLTWQVSRSNPASGSLEWGLSGAAENVAEGFMQLAAEAAGRAQPSVLDPTVLWFQMLKDSALKVENDGKLWTLRRVCEMSAILCSRQDTGERRQISDGIEPPLKSEQKVTPKVLLDEYLSSFQEKIIILDMCWAAKQHYREWTRWLGGHLRDGSKPDKAFRALLTSKKSPEEYRAETRPKGWK